MAALFKRDLKPGPMAAFKTKRDKFFRHFSFIDSKSSNLKQRETQSSDLLQRETKS